MKRLFFIGAVLFMATGCQSNPKSTEIDLDVVGEAMEKRNRLIRAYIDTMQEPPDYNLGEILDPRVRDSVAFYNKVIREAVDK